ncbi:hypothetical protein M758_7G082000 [Ceratodon purpureus]|nr:hypothetical protein M758_7G082000 [Ceratodon purpureus]
MPAQPPALPLLSFLLFFFFFCSCFLFFPNSEGVSRRSHDVCQVSTFLSCHTVTHKSFPSSVILLLSHPCSRIYIHHSTNSVFKPLSAVRPGSTYSIITPSLHPI